MERKPRTSAKVVSPKQKRTIKPNCVNNKEPSNLPVKKVIPVETVTHEGGL
jgi:hypothetical protein